MKLLRVIIFIVLILSLTNLTTHACEIDPQIYSELKKNPNQKVSVIVRLKSQLIFKNIPTDNKRANYVKKSLITHSKIFQKPLIEYIKKISPNVSYESLWITNAIVLTCDEKLLELLSKRDDIDSIWLNSKVQIIEPKVNHYFENKNNNSPYEWNLNIVNIPLVWEKYNLRGENILIGHIDTGCDGKHPDILGKIYAFRDFVSNNNGEPYDDQSHGTHTVGTILGGNASGKFIGAAPNAKIAVAKVFDKYGSAQDSNILKAMQWLMDPDDNPETDDTPRIISNSWGSSSQSKVYWDAVENWKAANIYPLFSAGNSGPSFKTIGIPAGYPHSVAVGATTINDKIASFSSRGPIIWDNVTYIKPDISAPGENINSAMPGGKWGIKSGTSMATPLVAGIIALLYQAKPELSINEVTEILKETSKDLGETGPDNIFGAGRIDAYQAITKVLNSGTLVLKVINENNEPQIANVELNDNLKFETKSDGTLKLTLEAKTYQVKIKCFGYVTETFGIKIEKDEVLNKIVKLTKSPMVSIKGEIIDKSNNLPISATISVLNTPLKPVQSDPKTGKFALILPYGNYKIKVNAFKYKTEIIDVNVSNDMNLKIELETLPPILLICDTNNAYQIAPYYKSTLDKLNLKYNYFDASIAEVTLDLILQYPMLIWFTGSDSNKTLTENDQTILKTYLDLGGTLLLTGQDIGYELKNTSFYSSYLLAKYESDSSKSKLIESTDEFLEFSGLNITLDGNDSANNQKYPDVISAISPAKVILRYKTSQPNGAAIAVSNNTYRIVYLGFGFEGIAFEENRCNFMKKIVSFLMPNESRINNLITIEQKLNFKNTNELTSFMKIVEIETEKIILDTKNKNYKKLNEFISMFEQNLNSKIYQLIANNLKKALFEEINNSENNELKLIFNKLNELLSNNNSN